MATYEELKHDEQKELTNEDYLAMENDILRGLIDAARDKDQETVKIEVARNGKVYFSFRVRGLTEEEDNACREQASKYVLNKRTGMKIRDNFNPVKYRSLLIYRATVEEDRKRLWDNQEVWAKLNVLAGWQLIDKVLMAGEKDAILAKIEEISGFKDENEEIEELKNS
jgi:hypothetical protein